MSETDSHPRVENEQSSDHPRAEIEQYLEQYNVERIFQTLVAKVIENRPQNVVSFLLDQLNELFMSELIEDGNKSDENEDVDVVGATTHKPRPRQRRGAVSGPTRTKDDDEETKTREKVPKSDEQMQMIDKALMRNCLSSFLDAEQRQEVAEYMHMVEAAEDEVIIRQGEFGDTFYILESGECEIFVAKKSEETTAEDSESELDPDAEEMPEPAAGQPADFGTMVYRPVPGDSFGELALMYAAPRAATIVAKTPCRLWAIEGHMYQAMVQDTVKERRSKYEGFLGQVPVLSNLTPSERSTISDALVSVEYGEGDVIIREGEVGDAFYFIERGTVEVSRTMDGEAQVLAQLEENNFFGEAALISQQPRNATVTAVTAVKCVSLDRSSFYRLLGPIQNIITRKCF
ncbi:cAMP/cGMP-dependent protein kinase [Carpediemonas membranifera]|uniref:cAMP/cGMP-dependent protein kinase n=1 Tax=Carpediemonas membranifera TaxID=201153 RepID=A0A8J6AWD9_9EUKA|nr:cAMP/cGMP-dependent protein kinase [Carpediemonas membranifera]|eukprot:KAG9395848.1 cAMP/cGMP-dependent protein kinase [Carpediemonas membranifera]